MSVKDTEEKQKKQEQLNNPSQMYIYVVHIYWSFNHILAETLLLKF